MLHSSNTSPQRKRKDAFTSVAIAVCLDRQNATQNHALASLQAAVECIIAITIASSIGLVVIIDPQLAH